MIAAAVMAAAVVVAIIIASIMVAAIVIVAVIVAIVMIIVIRGMIVVVILVAPAFAFVIVVLIVPAGPLNTRKIAIAIADGNAFAGVFKCTNFLGFGFKNSARGPIHDHFDFLRPSDRFNFELGRPALYLNAGKPIGLQIGDQILRCGLGGCCARGQQTEDCGDFECIHHWFPF
ncbi:MAG: hypothetical protein ACJA06_002055 [Halocynthiibacter sp.]|jgi:hypothetical protein